MSRPFILILDHTSIDYHVVTDFHGFIEVYADYKDAITDGDEAMENEDCEEYDIYEWFEIP